MYKNGGFLRQEDTAKQLTHTKQMEAYDEKESFSRDRNTQNTEYKTAARPPDNVGSMMQSKQNNKPQHTRK